VANETAAIRPSVLPLSSQQGRTQLVETTTQDWNCKPIGGGTYPELTSHLLLIVLVFVDLFE
jgi:hypothetical protein